MARRISSTEPRVDMWQRCTCPPVSSASRMSRATMISSAAAGMPLRPSRVETIPSCIAPPAASVGSSQWSATGMPKVRAYSSAVRIRWLDDDRLAVVAHRHRAGPDQLAELGQLLPLLPERDGADRDRPAPSPPAAPGSR